MWGAISGGIKLLLAVVDLGKWVYAVCWSPAAKWLTMDRWRRRQAVKTESEVARVKDAYKRIDATPPAPDPATRLNDAWNKKP